MKYHYWRISKHNRCIQVDVDVLYIYVTNYAYHYCVVETQNSAFSRISSYVADHSQPPINASL